jgi:acetylornithine/N-succinyldiaminopimelate aminotransferase
MDPLSLCQDPLGRDSSAILERDADCLLPVYARYPIVMERGKGVYLFDIDGRPYLDMMAGLGVNALGHAHPRMLAAMADQAERIVHLSPQYSNPHPGHLAERLCDLAGMAGAFFSTGGSEAVEGALKLARSLGSRNFSPRKHGIVALRSSYHGRTFGSLSVTGQQKYQADFGPCLPGVSFIDRNDLGQLEAAVSEDTCAILIEPLLGEGGVHECHADFLQAARRLATRHGAALIFDEIQSGLGRTGRWFASEPSGVRPDILILGKPLGGGLPLSAILVTDELFHAFGMARHGSTLGGSPLACRLGLEFLAIMEEEDILACVADTGAYLSMRLAEIVSDHDVAVEARGTGLMQAVELAAPARPIVEAALAQGVMLNCVQGNVLRFLPPLIIDRSHVDQAMDLLAILLEVPHFADADRLLATATK